MASFRYSSLAFYAACTRFLLLLILSPTTACQQPVTAETPVVARDTTITPTTAYSDLFFDSLQLEQMIEQKGWNDSLAQQLRKFYNNRNYEFAWFTNTGFTEQATIFWNVQSDYIQYSGDSSLYHPVLQKLMDSAEAGQNNNSLQLTGNARLHAEVLLTTQFIRYAHQAYQGNVSMDADDLSWYIPRKRINTFALLDSLIKYKGKNIEAYEPVSRQYQRLKRHLLHYLQLKRSLAWTPISFKSKKLQKGDTAQAVTAIKQRLRALGDYPLKDTSALFTDSLRTSVKQFQHRFGLKEDGIIGSNTLHYLNKPLDQSIRQMLVNMERMRWIPTQPTGDFVLVNIPQFRLTVFEGGRPLFGMNIVVGTTQHHTVIFTGTLKYMVFSPYWNVPPGILKNEVLPDIAKDSDYLEKNNMEWHGTTVRQRPGHNNALGQVKFLFPNNYNIYLHDTPAKSLFGEDKRTFSHGCIRIAEPRRLAIWLLQHQPEWTTERIDAALQAGRERTVTVKKPIPVFITYFTAWVDHGNQLNFRDDVYGHDKRLAERLFSR